MPYFGYSRYPMKVRTVSILRLVSWAFCSPPGRRRRRSSSRRSCSRASFRPCSKRRAPAPGSKFLTLPRINGTRMAGCSAPARPRDVHLADAAHSVPVEVGLDGVASLRPSLEPRELVQEAVVVDLLQELDQLGMGADHVRHVQEREPHLRGDVVRDRLRQPVRGILLTQPVLELLVQPPGSVHRRHEGLVAARIEQQTLELLEVGEDELEQLRPGLAADVVPQASRGIPGFLRSAP